jgi:hypothetical protein
MLSCTTCFKIKIIGSSCELLNRRKLRPEDQDELDENSKRTSATANILCTKVHKYLVVSHIERIDPSLIGNSEFKLNMGRKEVGA